IGASSFSPSPITTVPSMRTVSRSRRMASTAAWSAASLSPRPIQRAEASAAASVTRTSSSARLRSGAPSDSAAMTPPVAAAPPSSARTSPRSSDAGWLFLHRLVLAQRPGHQDANGSEEGDGVAPLEADLDGAGLPEDDPIHEDEQKRDEPQDRGELAAVPAQFVAAHDDPGKDERHDRDQNQRVLEEVEGLPRVSHPVMALDLRVLVEPVGAEPGQEGRDEEQDARRHPQHLRSPEPRSLEVHLARESTPDRPVRAGRRRPPM